MYAAIEYSFSMEHKILQFSQVSDHRFKWNVKSVDVQRFFDKLLDETYRLCTIITAQTFILNFRFLLNTVGYASNNFSPTNR